MSHGEGQIAVIGLACRFPAAPDEHAFWRNLRDGRDCIRFFTRAELEAAGIAAEDLDDPAYVPAGGFLDDVDRFDAGLFGYSPAEARSMDPQQRLFLETVWTALENAGHRPSRFEGQIGVWAGASLNTYQLNNVLAGSSFVGDMENLEALLSSDKDYLATRVSYKFGLTGPSMTVQTACSTSLVAVCQGAQSLVDYQCDMAVAGGVSVRVPQVRGYRYRPEGILSPDGHCRPFDAGGRGTVFSNGVGVVVLRRLDEAVADGDDVRAVLRGWAVNNDGARKVGYTAPSVDGHADVVATAQALAGVEASRVGYVEAHGTATRLGDPIEVAALTNAFRAHTEERGFCALGSVKSNIGHLDAAAGVAGLIKTILALEHAELPPTVHFERPNPEIRLESSPFYVSSRLADWPEAAHPRLAGVSSLGIGGTNAHVVVEEAPSRTRQPTGRTFQLLPVSAATEEALGAAVATLATELEGRATGSGGGEDGAAELADVAFTLGVGRAELPYRSHVVCRDLADAARALAERDTDRAAPAGAAPGEREVAFLFPGQGSQYAGMARGIHDHEPVFRESFERCAAALAARGGPDLVEILVRDAEAPDAERRIERTEICQPALFAVEYALGRLFLSWGVRPRALLGHSVGEYVAATLAGVFSPEDGVTLVAERGRLMQELPAGAMLAIARPADEVRELLGPELSVAAVNAPEASVVSGPTREIERLAARCERDRIAARRLRTSHAFHSPMMEPILGAFADLVRGVERRPPRTPFVSNVTGTWIEEDRATDPDYWATHLRSTVLFSHGIETLLGAGVDCLVELGPGRTLLDLAARHEGARRGVAVAALRRRDESADDEPFLLRALGRLWAGGARVDWAAVTAGERRCRVALPTYPFARRRHWIDPPTAGDDSRARPGDGARPERRRPLENWFYRPTWRRSSEPPARDRAADGVTWAVFADEAGLAELVVRRREEAGRRVVTVRPAADAPRGLERLTDTEYALDPGAPEGYERLFARLARDGRTPGRIAHLWTVSESEAPHHRDRLERGFYSLLFLAQAIGGLSPRPRLDILFVAAGLESVSGDEPLAAETAVALGPCRVIPREYPDIGCRAVDVPSADVRDASPELVDLLLAELEAAVPSSTGAGLPAPLVALRPPDRWVRELAAIELAESPLGESLRLGGHYLITGGTGGVGLALGEYLARSASARLSLLARTPVPPPSSWDAWLAEHDGSDRTSRVVAGLRRIEAAGGAVGTWVADVTDRRQTETALLRAREAFGPIDGVIHAAGVPGGGLVQLKSRQAAAAVLAPKVAGTRVLLELLGEEPDFVLLCSSLASELGGVGQVDYCGANAFLDALASTPTATSGRRLVSVAWDTWRDAGMAVDTPAPPGLEAERRERLSLGMTHDEATEALSRILGSGMKRIVVSTTHPAERRTDPASEVRDGSGASAPPERGAARPGDGLEDELARIWETTLGVERVGPEDNYFELGGQSLQAVTVFTEIDKRFGVRLPLTTLFEAPTVGQLAKLVRARERTASWSCLVPLRAEGAKCPLFVVSGLNLLLYRDLVERLGPDQPVYGLQGLGLDGSPPPFTNIHEQATHYLGQVRSVRSDGPFLLCGKSAHGLIALEMARQLTDEGVEDVLVLLIDSLAPPYFHANFRRLSGPRYRLQVARQIVDNQREILAALPARERPGYVWDKSVFMAGRWSRRLRNRLFPQALDQVQRAYRKAMFEYRAAPYAGPVELFRATRQRPHFAEDPQLGWGELLADLRVHDIPGYHASILMEPHVRQLAEEFAGALERFLD